MLEYTGGRIEGLEMGQRVGVELPHINWGKDEYQTCKQEITTLGGTRETQEVTGNRNSI